MEGDTNYLEKESSKMEQASEIQKLQESLYENTGLRKNEQEKNKRIAFFPKIAEANPGEADVSKTEAIKRFENITEGTEKVVSNLSHTLGDIGIDAIEQAELFPDEKEKYLLVAKTVNLIAATIKETGAGNIVYRRDTEGEAMMTKKSPSDGIHPADKVYVYKAGGVNLEGQKVAVNYFIRPTPYTREITTRSGGKMRESKEARTSITIKSRDLPHSEDETFGTAGIRIDPPSPYSEGKLTYDVIIGGDEENLINKLDLGKAGQGGGHHFQSVYKATDLNLEPHQIHGAIAARLESLTSNH